MNDMMQNIEDLVSEETNPAGTRVKTIDDRAMAMVAERHTCSIRDVSIQWLRAGVVPLRYLRNGPILSLNDQALLAESQVAVAGCGGLGGQVILLLTRLGVGRILVVDPDVFDETNLNRQALCRTDNLGMFKAEEAARQCALINPAVIVDARVMAVNDRTAPEIFSGVDVMVDALDNAQGRRDLAGMARDLGVPLVHGTVAGFEGRVMTVYPGMKAMDVLYPETAEQPGLAAESLLGTPAPAPAFVATFQAMAVTKILLNRNPMTENGFLHLDLDHMSLFTFFL